MEVITLQQEKGENSEESGKTSTWTNMRGKPCVCGLCNCNKKHKCPVHYHLVTPRCNDPSLLPKSEYYTIYCKDQKVPLSQVPPGPQRGIKLYPRILPAFPKIKLESTTDYDRSFPDPGPQKVSESFKPQEYYMKSNAKFYDETSYKAEFPVHPLPPQNEEFLYKEPLVLPMVSSESSKKPSYETSHKRFFPRWKDIKKCRPLPYGEPLEEPFFSGTFSGETVTMSEFPSKVAEPRVTCYPKEEQHIREGKFSDKTTTMEDTFTLPHLVGNEREGPFLKNKSKKSEESIPVKEDHKRPTNKTLTQYQRDNQPLVFGYQLEKRKMKPPYPDTISLSMSCTKLPQINTVQKLAYPNWGPQEVPSLLKRGDETEVLTGPFNDITEYNTEYILKPTQVTNCRQQINEKTRKENGEGGKKTFKQQKQIIHFDKVPFPVSVNQSDYFKFTKAHPRYRHGDKSERLYCGPSSAKFGCPTKYQLDFPPKAPQGPTQCYKLVPQRPIVSDKFQGDTSYNEHYPVRPLPIKSACPAGQLLLLQPFY